MPGSQIPAMSYPHYAGHQKHGMRPIKDGVLKCRVQHQQLQRV